MIVPSLILALLSGTHCHHILEMLQQSILSSPLFKHISSNCINLTNSALFNLMYMWGGGGVHACMQTCMCGCLRAGVHMIVCVCVCVYAFFYFCKCIFTHSPVPILFFVKHFFERICILKMIVIIISFISSFVSVSSVVCGLKQMFALKCAHALYCPIKIAFRFIFLCALVNSLTLKLRVSTLCGIFRGRWTGLEFKKKMFVEKIC